LSSYTADLDDGFGAENPKIVAQITGVDPAGPRGAKY
jgi:hypothetical protein